jgi:hypothetical protein
MWSFFSQVLGQRPLVRDERARHDLQAQLRGLLRGSCSWRSETALGFCVRAAAKASEDFEKAGAPFDAADCATALWNGFQEERKAILERVESLYPPAIHECHVHGDLTRTAHDAVRQLVEMLRGLWGVVEWDDWSERSRGVVSAIHEASLWAVPPPAAQGVSPPVAAPREGGALGNRAIWLANAMLLVREHPEWTDAKIAREVGVHPATLCRCPEYRLAASMAREQRKTVPKGRADGSGGIEAEAPADSVVGEPVPGSRRGLRRERCAGCNEWMGVAPDMVGQSPLCERCQD